MNSFTKNDRVKIRHTSIFYARDTNNPANVIGTVTFVDADEDDALPVYVKWDTGTNNAYGHDDLEHARGIVIELDLPESESCP